MNQVLSQSEVDALLNAVSEGGEPAGPGAGATQGNGNVTQMPGTVAGGGGGVTMQDGGGASWGGDVVAEQVEVQSYDLTNQDRVIRGRMPTLDIIYERFIRLYRMSLSMRFKLPDLDYFNRFAKIRRIREYVTDPKLYVHHAL